MFIYLITNSINGKCYVGQTTRSIASRWHSHNYTFSRTDKRRTAIHLALKKYGKHNFTVQEIDQANDLDELNEKEAFWIAELGTLSPGGYNLTMGGGNKRVSDSTRVRMSAAQRGKKRSDETRAKLRESHLGHKVTDVTKQKLSLAHKGKPVSDHVHKLASWKNSKLFILKRDGMYYAVRNMKNFCEAMKLFRSDMSLLCTGRRSTWKGFELVTALGVIGTLGLKDEAAVKAYVLLNNVSNEYVYFL